MKNKICKIGAGVVVALFLMSTTSAAISSPSVSDMSNAAREKYTAAKTEYQKTSESYEDTKQDWLTAKDKYRQTKNAEDLTTALEKANTYLSSAEERLVNHIEKVSAYVEGESNLDDTEKQRILDELNSYKIWLEEKQQEITAVTTKTELTDIAKTVRDKWQEIKQVTRKIIGQTMNAKILRLIEKAETAAAKIDNMLQKLKEQGKDTAALEDWLNDFYEKITLVKEKYQAAKEKYAEITDLNDADTLIKDGKAFLMEAKRYLKNAYNTLREIVKELKKYGDKEIAVSGTGTLIAEGDGSAYVAGDGTIELSGDEGTLIITDHSGDMTITVTGFGEKTEIESNKWQYTGTGSATVTGSDMVVELEGSNIQLTAKGTGSATLTGTGTYTIYKRSSDENQQYIADGWTSEGATIALTVEGG